MANTFTQLNIHTVFAVRGRENLIIPIFRNNLYKYISGIINQLGEYSLAVNGSPDHVHAFFELKPTHNISDLVQKIKASSSKWINESGLIKGKFSWQEGFGAFSYSRSQRDNVIKYIILQEEQHKKKSFKEEYLELLTRFEIDYDPNYLFDFYD